jgi:hypothetical protein
MRIIIALAILAVFLSLGGCSRNNLAYAKPVPWTPLPYPTRVSSAKPSTPVGSNGAVEQEAQVKFEAAMVGLAEGVAQEGPKDIIAAQIRSQGYACAANQAVWMLRCQNASYRVTLIPNLAAKVEKVGEEVRQEVHNATAPDDKEASSPPATTDTQ